MTILTEPLAATIPDEHESTVDYGPLRPGDPTGVGDWLLVSRLGRGGMADVFYATAHGGQSAAVKILRPGPHTPRTCRREYHLASTVDAGCTAPPLAYGISPAGPYLVMTHLPGYRGATTMVGRSPPATELWAFGLEVARILSNVHASGIVHCDVKPSNLLIRGPDVRLIDFGTSHYVGEYFGADGTVQCTRGWAAPEQLRRTGGPRPVEATHSSRPGRHLRSAPMTTPRWQFTPRELDVRPAEVNQTIMAIGRPASGRMARGSAMSARGAENGWLAAAMKTVHSTGVAGNAARHWNCAPIDVNAANGTRNFIDAANQIQ